MIQAVIARIDFEKRQGSKDLVLEIFAAALQRAIDSKDHLQVTYISCRFAQYLVAEANDAKQADEIFQKATVVPSANLYRAWVKLAEKHKTCTVSNVYDKALKQAEEGTKFDGLFENYIGHLESNSDPSLPEIKTKLENLGLLGTANPE